MTVQEKLEPKNLLLGTMLTTLHSFAYGIRQSILPAKSNFKHLPENNKVTCDGW
jgi:hypothetical protein